MRCSGCQAANVGSARFYEECSARPLGTCPHGRAEVSRGKSFCRSCGGQLADRATDRVRPPVAYTPEHLAERILTSKVTLEGEQKIASLFADMKASMELLADRNPEEPRKILDPVLEHVMEAVHRCEGTVNQLPGDGIMALLGVPRTHEDQAVRACYAALGAQAAIRRYAEKVRRTHRIEVEIRVGLNGDITKRKGFGAPGHIAHG